jgi:hypothetical protein
MKTVKRYVAIAILLEACLQIAGCEALGTMADLAQGVQECSNRCGNNAVCQNQCASEKADGISNKD